MDCSTPGSFVLHYLPEIVQIHVHWVSDTIILCHALLLLPSVFPSITVFPNESALHIRWPTIGASATASFLPMNVQGWFPLGLTDLISLQSRRLWESFLQPQFKSISFRHLVFCMLPTWLSGKESSCQSGTAGLIPGLGRASEGGNGNPLQYSCGTEEPGGLT